MLKVFGMVVRRDLRLAYRRRSDILVPAMFFLLATSLFPFGVGPDPRLLQTVGPGVIWVAALLASVLANGRLFAEDLADGSLEQMRLTTEPLVVVVGGKIVAHWIVTGLPLVLLSPLLAVQFDLALPTMMVLAFSLALGTPILSLLGSIGAALTLNVRGGGVLVPLLVLPLSIPVLVFGAGAVDAAVAGTDPAAHLYLLGAGLAVGAALAPWVTASALRIVMD
jgi:heme exporter protein B